MENEKFMDDWWVLFSNFGLFKYRVKRKLGYWNSPMGYFDYMIQKTVLDDL